MKIFAAYLLAVFACVLVFREKTLNKCRAQCFVALFAHQLAVLTNLYVAKLPGNAGDARRFFTTSLEGFNSAELVGTGKSFYCNFLALIYSVVGPSREIAFESSFIGFALVLIATGKLVHLLGYEDRAGMVVLLLGLSPAAVCYTSSILREVWQQLFLVLACFFALKLRRRFTLIDLTLLVVSLLILGCLQKGLALYAILFGVMAFVFLTQGGAARGPMVVISFLVIFSGGYFNLLGVEAVDIQTSSNVVEAFSEGEILDFAVDYRDGLNEARANYADHLELGTVSGLISALPQLVFYYWFCPLPWQAEEAIDVISMFEIIVRSILLLVGLVGFQAAGRDQRAKLSFLWVAFFALEMMWAVGTGNWGTAARHRTVGIPLFSALAVSGLVGAASRPESDHGVRTSVRVSKREELRRRRSRRRQVQRNRSEASVPEVTRKNGRGFPPRD